VQATLSFGCKRFILLAKFRYKQGGLLLTPRVNSDISMPPVEVSVQMRKGPIVVMLLTAVLTYEGLSRLMPESPVVASATQLQAGTAVLPSALSKAPAPYMTPAKIQVQPVMNPYEARSTKKKRHAQAQVGISPAVAMTSDSSEMSITAPVTQIELQRDLDLHMVPQVIVLPKMDEAQVAPPVFSNRNMRNLVKSYN